MAENKAKVKNVNTSMLALSYARMTEVKFEENLKRLGFTGDFKKAYTNLKERVKADEDSQAKKAKRLAKK